MAGASFLSSHRPCLSSSSSVVGFRSVCFPTSVRFGKGCLINVKTLSVFAKSDDGINGHHDSRSKVCFCFFSNYSVTYLFQLPVQIRFILALIFNLINNTVNNNSYIVDEIHSYIFSPSIRETDPGHISCSQLRFPSSQPSELALQIFKQMQLEPVSVYLESRIQVSQISIYAALPSSYFLLIFYCTTGNEAGSMDRISF